MASDARVSLNEEQCERLAATIHELTIPADAEEPTGHLDLAADTLANFYFVVVAICHQTSPRNRPALEGQIGGRTYKGWDYLRESFAIATRANPRLVYAESLITLQPHDLDRIIRTPDSSAVLTDLSGRCALLHATGQRLLDQGWNSVQDVYHSAHGYIARDDPPGLLKLLSEFTAYRDPVQKKSLYFLALMRNHGLWHYPDDAALAAPVDYHEVRGHLRYGTVAINDPSLRAALTQGDPVDSAADLAIRSTVSQAINRVSQLTGHSPSVLHYFFWNLFRNCCPRAETHCHDCSSSCRLPERYRDEAFVSVQGNRCQLSEHCSSRDAAIKLLDHATDTDYY